jgi:hypothetical protein
MEQVRVIGILGDLSCEQFQNPAMDQFGQIRRAGITFYRIRIDDLRFYFEFRGDSIFCHHILPKHSLEDFCFRLGIGRCDDHSLEHDENFWNYLENGEKLDHGQSLDEGEDKK